MMNMPLHDMRMRSSCGHATPRGALRPFCPELTWRRARHERQPPPARRPRPGPVPVRLLSHSRVPSRREMHCKPPRQRGVGRALAQTQSPGREHIYPASTAGQRTRSIPRSPAIAHVYPVRMHGRGCDPRTPCLRTRRQASRQTAGRGCARIACSTSPPSAAGHPCVVSTRMGGTREVWRSSVCRVPPLPARACLSRETVGKRWRRVSRRLRRMRPGTAGFSVFLPEDTPRAKIRPVIERASGEPLFGEGALWRGSRRTRYPLRIRNCPR